MEKGFAADAMVRERGQAYAPKKLGRYFPPKLKE